MSVGLLKHASSVVKDRPIRCLDPIKQRIKKRLRDPFDISHSTLEIETTSDRCRDRTASLIHKES